ADRRRRAAAARSGRARHSARATRPRPRAPWRPPDRAPRAPPRALRRWGASSAVRYRGPSCTHRPSFRQGITKCPCKWARGYGLLVEREVVALLGLVHVHALGPEQERLRERLLDLPHGLAGPGRLQRLVLRAPAAPDEALRGLVQV